MPIDRAEAMPAAFARAWNRRDADGIAALFEAKAEFVNVTGLWWHDREAIGRAHAYGLARIFDRSHLAVTTTRVRALAPDIALVHARMRLTGQTGAAGIAEPGVRRNLFTFVMRRTGAGWLCTAAHNTDIVPGAETHIVDADGHLGAVDYRRQTQSSTPE
ncbi:MAG: SgcJ/EcaC family oxidoreductase [Xanthomonadales bacterium]|nr:SgcJ/EcaC family oxidoreductase [Xanthomonadales bacterium]